MSLFDSIKKHYNHGLFGFPGAHATPNSPPIALLVGAVSKGKNMKDQTIELPPLFLPGASGGYTKEEMQLYAREAVEADRQRRHLKERAQLDAEWFSLRQMKEAYEADRRRIEGEGK